MAKKHKGYKPQIRKKQKDTVGRIDLVEIDVIYMDREKDADGVQQVFAACTCGNWRSSSEAKTFGKIGTEAKEHVEATGHQLRQH